MPARHAPASCRPTAAGASHNGAAQGVPARDSHRALQPRGPLVPNPTRKLLPPIRFGPDHGTFVPPERHHRAPASCSPDPRTEKRGRESVSPPEAIPAETKRLHLLLLGPGRVTSVKGSGPLHSEGVEIVVGTAGDGWNGGRDGPRIGLFHRTGTGADGRSRNPAGHPRPPSLPRHGEEALADPIPTRRATQSGAVSGAPGPTAGIIAATGRATPLHEAPGPRSRVSRSPSTPTPRPELPCPAN